MKKGKKAPKPTKGEIALGALLLSGLGYFGYKVAKGVSVQSTPQPASQQSVITVDDSAVAPLNNDVIVGGVLSNSAVAGKKFVIIDAQPKVKGKFPVFI